MLQFTQSQFEEAVMNLISIVITPLEEKVLVLETELVKLKESRDFISDKHDELSDGYGTVVRNTKEQKRNLAH